LNPGPTAPESSTLTTRLPSHPWNKGTFPITRHNLYRAVHAGRVKCRRNRTVFSDHHLANLERNFERQKYLSTRERATLADRLGLSQIQVKTWYQNRRMKWKKQVRPMRPIPFLHATLARVLAIALYSSVCLFVCLSVTSRSSIKTAERIELVFGMEASFHPSYNVLTRNLAISKIRVFPSGTLSQTLDLENFASVCRSSKRVIDLARKRWTLRA